MIGSRFRVAPAVPALTAAVMTAAVLAAAILLAGTAAAPARADQLYPGDAEIGRAVAMRWCAACHVVRGSQTQGGDVGPTFEQIAGKGKGLDWLDAFLADPHPPMPDMSLTRQEIRDLRAYIESLRAAR